MEKITEVESQYMSANELQKQIDHYLETPVLSDSLVTTYRPVECFDINTKDILRIFPSRIDVATCLKISKFDILNVCNGSKESCYGLGFKYYEGPPIDCKYRISYK